MFYYYGSKKIMAKHYPSPIGDRIIEPFAGSASYAVYWLCRSDKYRAVLIEKDKRVVDLWNRLLSMTQSDIMKLRCPRIGDKTSDYLIMVTATGNAINRCKSMTVTSRMPRIFEIMKGKIAEMLPMVKGRIEIVHGEYSQVDEVIKPRDTIFVDPPYAPNDRTADGSIYGGGNGYCNGCNSSDLDYEHLREKILSWSEIAGVVVCEYYNANWMDFRLLGNNNDSQKRGFKEGIWTNIDRDFSSPA